ncbi:hypothetical protein NL108_009512 [Boleophthalmus pectinirostris]|uniref:protein LSM14 homolog B n=1 Tax=Boleophthalmus pectinirostris TaxID=150288 RepID=UPI00242AE1F3|nr:protein LSM14 homolog B [Boleophthalmus pectinirostris]KAJ0064539.1 hypothetical protein NL108_009512 [Boleophthalmus pectinirostris]
MNSSKPYIGCKIALISKALNRYVGILYTIDKVNSTVVLAKVKCYGTEGRLTDQPTPPRDDIYEYITFRGSDIKDINLCELPPSQYGLAPDPAILLSSGASLPDPHSTLHLGAVQVPIYHQVSAQPVHIGEYTAALGIAMKRPMVEKAVQTIGTERNRRILHLSNDDWEQNGPPTQASVQEPLQRQPARPPPRQQDREPPRHRPPPIMRGGPRFPPAQQNHGYWQNMENIPPRRRQGSWRGRNRPSDGPLRFDTDFDFDYSNAQFIKDYNIQEPRNATMENEANDSPFDDDPFGQKCVYNKAKCFYDNIPSPSEQKLRLSWAEERQRNMETFGASGWPLRSPGFRGGYTRGRGQRSGQRVFAF